MVAGGVDVGKTSFCTYLVNNALKKQRKVSMIDADLGQSDLGPPSTISSCSITKPVRDPFEMGAENVFFIGVTSPSGAVAKIVEGITDMKDKVLKRGAQVLVINTDGWVEGEEAVQYKMALVKQIKPDIVVGIQEQNELASLLNALSETENITIETSTAVRKRDREERKLLRELGYKKYLKNASNESFHLNRIQISGVPFWKGSAISSEHLNKIVELLKTQPTYCEETPSYIFIVLNKEERTDKEIAADIEDALNKKVKIVFEGDEEGLLMGLHDKEKTFLGLGILQEIDYERMILKVYTRVKKDVASIHMGQIKLDKTGKELGRSEVFANHV
jgi:polynucleotide 5'-hydroxyl-kinase GRC3/NOL9